MRSVGDPICEYVGRPGGIIGTLQHPLFLILLNYSNIYKKSKYRLPNLVFQLSEESQKIPCQVHPYHSFLIVYS